LIIYVFPFPKSAPTAPELKARAATNLQAEIAAITDLLERFAGPPPRLVPHPAFGELSPETWGVLIYKHMAHHLEQFGL
jgi:hypothetical protein